MTEEILKKLGIKVTKQRKAVLEILAQENKAITAEEIYDFIEDKEAVNYSTVYRTLGVLSEKGALIKTGEPGGKTYYQLKIHHHAHDLECLGCHKHITIDACPLDAFSRTLAKETGFMVTEHQLQIKGYCPECAKNQKKE